MKSKLEIEFVTVSASHRCTDKYSEVLKAIESLSIEVETAFSYADPQDKLARINYVIRQTGSLQGRLAELAAALDVVAHLDYVIENDEQ